MPTLPEFAPNTARALHTISSCPHYQPTALHHINVDGLSIDIKDESQRFGLGSFKALGGVYAVVHVIQQQAGNSLSVEDVFDPARKSVHAATAFVCASAGNHGIAVAAGARLLGAQARIHLSVEVPQDFAERLSQTGATVVRSGDTYEQSLVAALADATASGATLVADTAWDGYVEIPSMIMEGYTVIGKELADHYCATGSWPSDVFLQAGVGGLAGALTWHIRNHWAEQPRIVIVEPEAAPCLAKSAIEGAPSTVEGPVSTMGRLDCKTASPLSVHALRHANVEYRAIADSRAEAAVALLQEYGLGSTPSGAAGLAALMEDQSSAALAGSRPLMIMSEGALAS